MGCLERRGRGGPFLGIHVVGTLLIGAEIMEPKLLETLVMPAKFPVCLQAARRCPAVHDSAGVASGLFFSWARMAYEQLHTQEDEAAARRDLLSLASGSPRRRT